MPAMSVPSVTELLVFVYCLVLTIKFPKLIAPSSPPDPDPELLTCDHSNDYLRYSLSSSPPASTTTTRSTGRRNFAAAVKEGDNLPPSQQPHPDTGLLVQADHSGSDTIEVEKDKVNGKQRGNQTSHSSVRHGC